MMDHWEENGSIKNMIAVVVTIMIHIAVVDVVIVAVIMLNLRREDIDQEPVKHVKSAIVRRNAVAVNHTFKRNYIIQSQFVIIQSLNITMIMIVDANGNHLVIIQSMRRNVLNALSVSQNAKSVLHTRDAIHVNAKNLVIKSHTAVTAIMITHKHLTN
jgi:hypothetical protein